MLPFGILMNLPALLDAGRREKAISRRSANIVISSLPGPRSVQYLDGAKLERYTVCSVLQPGIGVTRVAMSYADNLEMGFLACPDVVPEADLLPRLMEEALEEMEHELLRPPHLLQRSARDRRPARGLAWPD